MSVAYISVGSNIDPEENVERAVCMLMENVRIDAVSTFYRTKPIGRPEQQDFINGVLKIETDLSPQELKASILREIEEALGRQRSEDKYAPRTIDLDILLYDDIALDEDGLRLPDPDTPHRPFLAIPLCEITPDLVLPDSNRPIRDIVSSMMYNNMKALHEFTDRIKRLVFS